MYKKTQIRKKKMIYLGVFTFVIVMGSWGLQAQNYTISGTIKDAKNGEILPGASLVINDLPQKGTTSNYYGYYAISLPKGQHELQYDFLGYQSLIKSLDVQKDTLINIQLTEAVSQLEEVQLQSTVAKNHIRSTEVSVAKITAKEIETVPVLFGERDIIKTLQLLPGVKSAGEGSSGFFVRGGGADQNLLLLDEAPVYNASHLLGFFSIFNTDAVKDVKIYKGYMPAKYGGRLASLLDVQMKDGNAKELSASGGIGIISSKLTLEAPIVKEKGSFIISGRRTYADLFLPLSRDTSLHNNRLYFYDLNLKTNYQFDEKNKVYLSGYFGRDVLGFSDDFGFDWGNLTGTLRYNHIFNAKLFSNTSLIYSDFDYKISIGSNQDELFISANIKDYNFKQDFDYYLNDKNQMGFGFNVIKHIFSPGEINTNIEGINNSQLENKYALESSAYVSNQQKITDDITAAYGLRFNNFTQLGPGTIYSYNSYGEIESEGIYNRNEVVTSYNGWAPRASVSWVLNQNNSIKTSYTKTYQYLHLMSNSNGDNPTDVWLPSSNNIKPQIAHQVALGYFKNFGKEDAFQFSTETYYKKMQNSVGFRTGAEITLNPTVEGELIYGKGRAYGLEILLKKQKGKFTGWLGYTLARSEKKFEEVNNNSWFPAKQDRTHDISIVGSYQFSDRAILSANWVYYTGNAITFPTGRYELDGNWFNYYTERNAGRMPDYHRLDIGFILKNKPNTIFNNKNFESSWNFSIYNAYARENAYSISFEQSKDDPSKNVAVQTALFKIIPSISYQFKF